MAVEHLDQDLDGQSIVVWIWSIRQRAAVKSRREWRTFNVLLRVLKKHAFFESYGNSVDALPLYVLLRNQPFKNNKKAASKM